MDYLAQLVDDYNAGKVDLDNTLNRLEFLDWKENKSPLPNDYVKTPLDPADILVERERSKNLVSALRHLKETLSARDWRILVLTSKGWTQEKIAEKVGLSQRSVSRRLTVNIRSQCSGLDEYLRRPAPVYEAGGARVKIAYPSDAAMKNQRNCRMPEYLAESFGKTCVKCCFCETCRRKRDN